MTVNNNIQLRRRTSSATRYTEIKNNENKRRKSQHDHPIHVPKDSLFSSASGYNNYRGFLNLCLILLFVSNSRLVLENILKYGILVSPLAHIEFILNSPNHLTLFALFAVINVFLLASLAIERFLLRDGRVGHKTGIIASILNIVFLLSIPVIVFQTNKFNAVGASIVCMVYSIVSLKLVSYHMVNYWCRERRNPRRGHVRSGSMTINGNSKSEHSNLESDSSAKTVDSNGNNLHVSYPDNLNLKDMYYFIFAPTLCYELNFPRSERIRKTFLFKRILEMVILFQLDIGLVQQWMVPIVRNSYEPITNMDWLRMVERLLKLAVPNHLIWLIFFYGFFHSFLNVIGELMRFSDREFYRDWWNCESVNQFWSNWNIPVHRWCVRHVYVPLLSQDKIKLTRFHASTVVFLLSAFFHEYLISVPLNMYRLWSFCGMIAQLPFSMFVNRYLSNQAANYAVWVSLLIGQPLCIFMYYHDYYLYSSI